jgi:hypothetical protein
MFTSEIKQLLTLWYTMKRMISRHPATEQTELLLCIFQEKWISCCQKLLMEKRKSAQQATLNDTSFRKGPQLELSASQASTTNDP